MSKLQSEPSVSSPYIERSKGEIMPQSHSKPSRPAHCIEFTFTGILALCVSGTRDHFDVGIIKATDNENDGDIPNHTPIIEINGGGLNIRYEKSHMSPVMTLDIHNSGSSSIQLFSPGPTFERRKHDLDPTKPDNDHGHFGWIADIEGNEICNSNVNINSAALRSVLRVRGIDDGHFFTDKVSDGALYVKDPRDTRIVGRVGEIIKAFIPIPNGGATLRNGGSELTFNGGGSYEIRVSQICDALKCDGFDTSAFYNALHDGDTKFIDPGNVQPISAVRKITPQTGCPTVNFSLASKLPDPSS